MLPDLNPVRRAVEQIVDANSRPKRGLHLLRMVARQVLSRNQGVAARIVGKQCMEYILFCPTQMVIACRVIIGNEYIVKMDDGSRWKLWQHFAVQVWNVTSRPRDVAGVDE
jgi:hypothetical protein